MNFIYKRTTEDKVSIKGILSEDATLVTVSEKNGDRDILIKDYLNKFSNSYVEIIIKNKSEDDLSEDEE